MPNGLSAAAMVVPLGRARCPFDGTNEAARADGDSVAVACDEDGVGEGPNGVAEFSAIPGFDVDEVPHPTRRRITRTLQICATDPAIDSRGR